MILGIFRVEFYRYFGGHFTGQNVLKGQFFEIVGQKLGKKWVDISKKCLLSAKCPKNVLPANPVFMRV